MNVDAPMIEGQLVGRRKRFLLDLRLPDGELLTVHCPNTGTMEGCLEEGAMVMASRSDNPRRKLVHTAEWIRLSTGWVGINTHRANRIVEEALVSRSIAELSAYTEVRREVSTSAGSRLDFMLQGPGLPDCYVEVKNATWPTSDGGVAFPDAVTARGLKHLEELQQLARDGHRAVAFFLVNREGCAFFRPCVEKDPAYTRELARASSLGVEVLAYAVCFDPPRVWIGSRLPCRLEG